MRLFLVIMMTIVGLSHGDTEPLYNHFGIPYSVVHRGIDRLDTIESVFAKEFGKEDRLRKMAMAIVFPEVIRYEQSVDLIQAGLNKVKMNGSAVFDFSIGLFQIKPKFVERLRIAGIETEIPGMEALPYDLNQIVEMLETEEGSVHILRLVIELVVCLNPELMNLSPEKSTRLLSTAYTFGFFENLDELTKASQIPTWHCFGMIGYNRVPYSDVAMLYFSTSANEH